MPAIEVTSGPARVVASGSATCFMGHELTLTIEEPVAIVVDLAFESDPSVEDVAVDVATFANRMRLVCKNFDRADGRGSAQPVLLGEAGAFVVLERDGEPRYGALLGAGSSADGHHATAPDPSGQGLARAMRAALDDAGVAPEVVGYVNAHATGTASNDEAEWRAVVDVFGPDVPTSASKGFFGHTFGAAGLLEAIVCGLALRDRVLPPTPSFTTPRDNGPVDPVAGVARPASFDVAVSSNAAFGGSNAVVVIGRTGDQRALGGQPVYVRGLGSVSATDGRPEPDLGGVLPRVDPRDLDAAGALLAVAAGRALRDAGLKYRGSRGDRAGLVVGMARRAYGSSDAFRTSVDRRGLGNASATAFSRTVMCAVSGQTSRALGLRGPTATLATGPGSGLFAIAWAALQLADRDDADVLVAGGVDELDPIECRIDPERAGVLAEGPAWSGQGAAVAVLGREGRVRVAGVGLAGPGRLAEAVERAGGVRDLPVWSSAAGPLGEARERAELPGVARWVASPAGEVGYGPGFTAALAFVRAAGSGASALVVATDPDIGAVAIRLEVQGG
ncbi:MAG: hypothetical protein KC656_16175 [Myxococcales bacterium]|nr:hypothetical protein [Myxococcales bacterium]